MNSKALVVVVLLIACLAAWWFAKGDGDVAPPAPTDTGALVAPNARPATDALPAGTSIHGASAEAAGSQRTAADPVPESGKAPRRTVSIRGRVVDAQGAPRPNIELTSTSWAVGDGIEIGDVPLPDRDRAAGARRPRVVTQKDGTFALAVASDHIGQLDVRDDELVFGNGLPRFDGRKGDQDLGDLVAVRSGMLQGVVKDEHGRPVPDVKIAATVGVFAIGGTSSTKTDANGAFTIGKLHAGTWTLRTASEKFQPTTMEITLQPDERRTDLVVSVSPGQAIAGQVVDDLGMPVAGCKVASKRREARGGVDIERFTTDEAATTDAGGYFTLSGLTGETTTVRATSKGHASAVAKDVRVGTGDLVLRMDRLAEIRGILVGADEQPIAGSHVSLESVRTGDVDGPPDLDSLDLVRGERTKTAADGTFRVPGVKPGPVKVVAEGSGHRPVSSQSIEAKPGQVVDGVRLVAPTGATAKVEVLDAAGKPVEGAKVRVKRPDRGDERSGRRMVRAHRVEATAEDDVGGAVASVLGERDELGTATTDDRGIANVTGLPAGDAVVTAAHEAHADAEPVTVTLPGAGTTDVKLTMRTPGFAEIRVISRDGTPVPDCAFAVRGDGDDGSAKNGTTDDKGRARVGPLTPGAYTAFLTRGAQGVMDGGMFVMLDQDNDAVAGSKRSFRVVAGETTAVEIERPVLTRLFGTVRGPDGPVAGCTVSLGSAAADGLPIGLPGFGSRTATTGSDGSYAIDDVESGKYELRYGKPSQLVKSRVEVDVPPDTAELRSDLELRTGKIRVQVHSKATGEPLAGVSVEVERAAAKGPDGQPREQRRVMLMTISADDQGEGTTSMTMGGAPRALTGADGTAEIDDVPVGTYTVKIVPDKLAPTERADQVVVQGRVTDLGRIDVDQAGTIRGKVLGADGSAVPLALVQCRAADTTQWGSPELAQNGSFRFTGKKVGKHFVRAMTLGGDTNRTGPEVEVNVAAGETATTEVRLPAK